MCHKLYVVGAGSGSAGQLTPDARNIIAGARTVVAAPRLRELAGNRQEVIELRAFGETFSKIAEALARGPVAVLVSGDAGIFSLLPLIKKNFPDEIVEVIPGVSSMQTLCALAKTTWNDAVILSGHGRAVAESKILDAADQNKKTIFFCGPQWPPQRLCRILRAQGIGVKLTVGERLGGTDQRVTAGTPGELAEREFDSLSLVLIENPSPWEKPQSRPRDEDFIRADVPMTRETARSAILDALRLNRDSVLWDLGAGTGSVTAAAALICESGRVCAVEKNPAAAELVRRNAKKFHRHNVEIFQGNSAELVPSLPRPTHVFIGGSGAELRGILKSVAALGAGVRLVLSAVSLKTCAVAAEILTGGEFADFDAIQVSVSRAKKVGGTFIMAAQNPVTIFSAVTAAKEGM